MSTVGIFAGRGDVLVAMGLALVMGVWIGWKLNDARDWVRDKLTRKST
jgi:hypothetical protein